MSRSIRSLAVFVFGFVLGGVAVVASGGVLPNAASRFMEGMMRRMSEGENGPPAP